MSCLVTGAKGQLGTELCHYLEEKGLDYVATGVEELDITNQEQVTAYITEMKPSVVYHCAAYTAVDAAEDEGQDLNHQINVQGTENIAKACGQIGAKLVYISTDYVFDGNQRENGYLETDVTAPINAYGAAKLKGEEAVQTYCPNYYIIRTSWVFGAYGKNFVFTMQNLAKTHPKLTVVDDQKGRPTWTRHLAEFMVYAVQQEIATGVYHFSNEGICTWYEFAKEILKETEVEIAPVDSSQFPQKATRPSYSVLNLDKTKATGFHIPTWEEALKEMLATLN